MTTTTINRANGRAIYTTTSLPPHHGENLKRDGPGSPHSEYEIRRRAFRRASDILYLYQDLFTTFITLTYKDQHHDYQKIRNDLKNYFTRNRVSYIAVVEKHKSGNYHIHAITSNLHGLYYSGYRDKRGQRQCKWLPWEKNIGITDVKFISGTDEFFKVEKYIFKYMTKSEKVGSKYYLSSRDLRVFHTSVEKGGIPVEMLHNYPIDNIERFRYNLDNISINGEKIFYGRNTSIN